VKTDFKPVTGHLRMNRLTEGDLHGELAEMAPFRMLGLEKPVKPPAKSSSKTEYSTICHFPYASCIGSKNI
jgi:hypothetical protein